MSTLEIRYVWEWPVRVTHWINVIAILVLSITGFYIGDPFVLAPGKDAYVMGWMRYLHFAFGYLFAISLLVRLIWMFFGNQYASFKTFIPWISAQGRQDMLGTFGYYTFTKRKPPFCVGHNALAVVAYSGVFVLFLVQILSGLALYGQFAPGGFWDNSLGSLIVLFGSQGLRLTHHLIMWLLIAFAIQHVYSGWMMEIKEKNGTMGSIFSGYKFIDSEEEN